LSALQPRRRSAMALSARPGKIMTTRPRIIAVVDDDASMLTSIERLLGAYGFATKGFSSAEAFINLNAAAEADCLLVDIHLGGCPESNCGTI
jgi:FixJ family two-component response regulator